MYYGRKCELCECEFLTNDPNQVYCHVCILDAPILMGSMYLPAFREFIEEVERNRKAYEVTIQCEDCRYKRIASLITV